MLLDPDRALLARPELVIRDEASLEAGLDQIMRNLDFWLPRDADQLRVQLGVQVDMARAETLVSEAGLAALTRQAAARFAAPHISRRETTTPGVKADALEKKLSEIAGLVLSSRPAVARDIPPGHSVEIHADYGLLPAPFEKNSRAKNHITPVCHQADHGGWLDSAHSERPHPSVIARCVLDLIQQHPDATRLMLRFTVLRRKGQPVEWLFPVGTSPEGGSVSVQGTGRAPGYDEQTAPVNFTTPQLRQLAAQAPPLPAIATPAKP